MKVAVAVILAVYTVGFTSAIGNITSAVSGNSSETSDVHKRSLFSLPSLSDIFGFTDDLKGKKDDFFNKPKPSRPANRPYPAYYPPAGYPPMGYPAGYPTGYPPYSKPSYPRPAAYQKPAIPIRIELVLPTAVPTLAAAPAVYAPAAAPAANPAPYVAAAAPAPYAAAVPATPAPYAAAAATPARPAYSQPLIPQGYRSGDMIE